MFEFIFFIYIFGFIFWLFLAEAGKQVHGLFEDQEEVETFYVFAWIWFIAILLVIYQIWFNNEEENDEV